MLEIPCDKITQLYKTLDRGDVLVRDGDRCVVFRELSREMCSLILRFCDDSHVYNAVRKLYFIRKREKKLLKLPYFRHYFKLVREDEVTGLSPGDDKYIVVGDRDDFCRLMRRLCGIG